MREIKFRGKTANGEWVYGSLAYSENISTAIYFEVGKGSVKTFDFVYVKPETVGQFTGLHDSTTWKELTEQERKDWTMKGHMPSEWRGRKVYEGDIVRFIWWWFDGAERESELTGTIVYSSDNMSFQLKGVKNKEWRDFVGADEHDMDYLTPFSELNFCDADFKVIGTIHDNPELLEAGE